MHTNRSGVSFRINLGRVTRGCDNVHGWTAGRASANLASIRPSSSKDSPSRTKRYALHPRTLVQPDHQIAHRSFGRKLRPKPELTLRLVRVHQRRKQGQIEPSRVDRR